LAGIEADMAAVSLPIYLNTLQLHALRFIV
jgi:hypothetical protein